MGADGQFRVSRLHDDANSAASGVASDITTVRTTEADESGCLEKNGQSRRTGREETRNDDDAGVDALCDVFDTLLATVRVDEPAKVGRRQGGVAEQGQ